MDKKGVATRTRGTIRVIQQTPKGGERYVCRGNNKKVCGQDIMKDPISCDVCQQWYHLECQYLSVEALDAITEHHLFWLCDECKEKLQETLAGRRHLEQKVEKIEKDLKKEHEALEKKIGTKMEEVLKQIEETVNSKMNKHQEGIEAALDRQEKMVEKTVKALDGDKTPYAEIKQEEIEKKIGAKMEQVLKQIEATVNSKMNEHQEVVEAALNRQEKMVEKTVKAQDEDKTSYTETKHAELERKIGAKMEEVLHQFEETVNSKMNKHQEVLEAALSRQEEIVGKTATEQDGEKQVCPEKKHDELEKKIGTKMEEVLKQIEETVNNKMNRQQEIVEAALKTQEKMVEQSAKAQNEDKKSYAEIAKELKDIPRYTEEIRESTKNFFTSYMEQKEDKERRQNNLLLHNVRESQDHDPQQRKTHDTAQFGEVISALLGDVNRPHIEVDKIYRLGKRKEEEDSKPRLLLVRLKNKEHVDIMLKKRKLLRTNSPGLGPVFLTPDLTLEERKRAQELKQELEEKGKETHRVFRGKVVKR